MDACPLGTHGRDWPTPPSHYATPQPRKQRTLHIMNLFVQSIVYFTDSTLNSMAHGSSPWMRTSKDFSMLHDPASSAGFPVPVSEPWSVYPTCYLSRITC
eukprot:7959827-Alexandrium_andersonii.AAC.1